jgi:LPS-assembly lipoprotein
MIMSLTRLRVFAGLGLASLALGGCAGFTPLYAVPGVVPKMASIEVSRPDGRTGFFLGQYLDDDLGKNHEGKPIYRLLLRTNEVRIPRGITVDNVASRYEVDLNTTYTLVEIDSKKVITTGVVKVNATYDSANQPYAGLSAEENGEERAAEAAADRIRLELATFFASPRPNPPAATLNNVDIATYSERLQAASVLSPRERALGQPSIQSPNATMFGAPLQNVVTPDNPPAPEFSPSTDPTGIQPPGDTPNTSASPPAPDPAAIKTLPLAPDQ